MTTRTFPSTDTNWIEAGAAALARYREKDTIDQADTDLLAAFVEQALRDTNPEGSATPLTVEEWVVRYEGAFRPYLTREDAVAECERILADDQPRDRERGFRAFPPRLSLERRSKLRWGIEASQRLCQVVYSRPGTEVPEPDARG